MTQYDSYADLLTVSYNPNPRSQKIVVMCQIQYKEFDKVTILIDDMPFKTTIYDQSSPDKKTLMVDYTMQPSEGVNVKVQIISPFGEKFVTEPGFTLVYNPSSGPGNDNMRRYRY